MPAEQFAAQALLGRDVSVRVGRSELTPARRGSRRFLIRVIQRFGRGARPTQQVDIRMWGARQFGYCGKLSTSFPHSTTTTPAPFNTHPMPASIATLFAEFIGTTSFIEEAGHHDADIYNEFSLQHEFGIYLRGVFPHDKVQYERNAASFPNLRGPFEKREIDIVVFSAGGYDHLCAIELKFPRNGQHPETLFSFCRDIAFIEQLKRDGFQSAAAVIVTDDPLFYSGRADGIYAPFRSNGSLPLVGIVTKPTGRRDSSVTLTGRYTIEWKPIRGTYKYAVVEAL